jgi:hypothetical protein
LSSNSLNTALIPVPLKGGLPTTTSNVPSRTPCAGVDQTIAKKNVRAFEQRILPPTVHQCLVDIRAEERVRRNTASFVSNAKENTITTRRIDNARLTHKRTAVEYFEEVPYECPDIGWREELSKLASALQVIGAILGSGRSQARLGHDVHRSSGCPKEIRRSTPDSERRVD